MSIPSKTVNPGQTVTCNFTINQYDPSISRVTVTFSQNPPNGAPSFALSCLGSAINQSTNVCPLSGAVPLGYPAGTYYPDQYQISRTIPGAAPDNSTGACSQALQQELMIIVGTPVTPPPQPGAIQPVSIGP